MDFGILGAGTLCETFEGKIRDLNYKTIRYPGFVKQESVGLQEFLSTQWGGRIYAPDESAKQHQL